MTGPEIDAGLDAVEAQAVALGNALYDAIDARLAALAAQRDELANKVEGAHESQLQALEATAGRLGAKVLKSLDKQLGQVYTYAFPLGITYPTAEQAAYGLSTGDYGGSMGLPYPLTGPAFGPPAGVSIPPPGGTIGPVSGPGPIPLSVPPAPANQFGGGAVDGSGGRVPAGGGLPVPPPEDLPPPPPPAAPPPPAVLPPVPPPQAGPVPPPPGGRGVVCPPGWTWFPDPSGSGGNCQPAAAGAGAGPAGDCPPGLVPDPNWAPPPPPAGEMPQILGGWTGGYDASTLRPYGCGQVMAPWDTMGPGGAPNGQDVWCVAGSHLVPPRAGQARFGIPPGWLLLINPVNGWVFASDCAQVGWETAPVVSCDPTAPNALPMPGEPGSPAAPCVPELPGPAPGDFCPAPPPLACPGADPAGLGGAPPAIGEFCDIVGDWLQQWGQFKVSVADWIKLGVGGGGLSTIAQAITLALTGRAAPVMPDLVGRFAHYIDQALKVWAGQLNCDPTLMAPLVTVRAVMAFIDKWTGVVPDQAKMVVEQLSNTVCQSILPSASEANRAFLAKQADETLWECWTRAAGHHVGEARKVRDAGRARLTWREAVESYRRGWITVDRLRDAMGADAVITDQDRTELSKLSEWYPTLADALRWSDRQIGDDAVAGVFDLDAGGDDAWAAQAGDWARGHGVTKENWKYLWRAQQPMPGLGQLTQAYQRLRPDAVDDAVAFPESDFRAALKLHGYPDYWVDRFVALARHRPTRWDVRRMYQYHQVDEDQLKRLIQDQGYDSDYADRLVALWKQDRLIVERRVNGGLSTAALVRDYAAGILSRSELADQVRQVVYYDGQDQEILDNADQARRLKERQLAVAGLKSAFTKGLVSLPDAQAQLAQTGMDVDEIAELTAYWVRVRTSKPKQVPAATLCQWRTDGLITLAEQYNALVQLGYSLADAKLIVDDCTIKIERSLAKREEAALAKAQRAAAAAQKAAETAARNARVRVRIKSPAPPPATGNGQAGR